MMNAAQGQAAQQDRDQARHRAEERNAGQGDDQGGDRQPGAAARFQGMEAGRVAGKYDAGTITGRGGGFTWATSSTVIRSSGWRLSARTRRAGAHSNDPQPSLECQQATWWTAPHRMQATISSPNAIAAPQWGQRAPASRSPAVRFV